MLEYCMATKKQPPSETVGARIRALRLAANLTQDEFGAKLNVSRSAIAQWETDRAGQVRLVDDSFSGYAFL